MRGNESINSLAVKTDVLKLGPLVLVDFAELKFLVQLLLDKELFSMVETFILIFFLLDFSLDTPKTFVKSPKILYGMIKIRNNPTQGPINKNSDVKIIKIIDQTPKTYLISIHHASRILPNKNSPIHLSHA